MGKMKSIHWIAAMTAASAASLGLAELRGEDEGEFGPCSSQLEKLTPYWELQGFGQHGDITGFMRLSADARYMAFGSFGNYFVPEVPGDSEGGTRQIYRLDRASGEFEVITLAHPESDEQFANGPCGWLLDMSPNGRFIAFTSTATNLVEPHEEYITGEYTHIYVRDVETGVTHLASASSSGEPANAVSGFNTIGVSNQGYVVYSSHATNLVEPFEGHTSQIYLHYVASGETKLISVDVDGNPAQDGGSSSPAISADGRIATFSSQAALDPSLPWNFHNIWAHNISNGTTEAISVDSDGQDRFGVGTMSRPSADGRFVFFHFDSQIPLDPEMPDYTTLYVRDRATGQTYGVGTDINGSPVESYEYDIAISADGRYVMFDTWSQMTEAEPNDQRMVYRVDMETGEPTLASIDAYCMNIMEESDAIFPTMSGDGSTVIFTTVWDVLYNDKFGFDEVPHDWAHHVYAWIDPDFEPAGPEGDLNGDGVVDVADMLILLGAWGPCEDGPCPADLNSDGVVDVADLLILLSNWG